MKNLVEVTKQNTVLNALWYAERWGYDKENIKLCDIFGPGTDIPGYIGQLIFGKYRLVLIYTGQGYSLASHFDSDKEVHDFISENIDALFGRVIKKHADYIYTLNVVSVEELNDLHNRQLNKLYIKKAFTIFMPIIQKFMVDALTDSLEETE